MKSVATAPFTVSQLIEGPQGATGDTGPTGAVGPYVFMTKWAEDLDNASSITYWAGTESGAPYKNLTYYNGLWYACKKKYIRTASSNNQTPPNKTSYWTVMTNMRFIASEVILADRGVISLLQSNAIKMMDEQGRVGLIMSGTLIDIFVYNGTETTATGYMRLGGGAIGYYNNSNEAIWEIGPSGKTTFFNASMANGWVTRNLHLLHASNLTTAKNNAQASPNAFSSGNGTYYELTSVANSSDSDKLGRTTTNQAVDGVMIPNGYYCLSGAAAQKVSMIDQVVYTRTVIQYSNGYKVNEYEVTWNVV